MPTDIIVFWMRHNMMPIATVRIGRIKRRGIYVWQKRKRKG